MAGAGSQTEQATPRLRLLSGAGAPFAPGCVTIRLNPNPTLCMRQKRKGWSTRQVTIGLGAAPSAYHLGGHGKQQGSVWYGHFPKRVL